VATAAELRTDAVRKHGIVFLAFARFKKFYRLVKYKIIKLVNKSKPNQTQL